MRDREPLMVETRLQDLYSKFGVEHYSQLTNQNIRELAYEFEANYVLESVVVPLKNFPVMFENKIWRVYQVRN